MGVQVIYKGLDTVQKQAVNRSTSVEPTETANTYLASGTYTETATGTVSAVRVQVLGAVQTTSKVTGSVINWTARFISVTQPTYRDATLTYSLTSETPQELAAKAPVEIVERINDELDSGTLRFIKTEQNAKGLHESLAGYIVDVDDGDDLIEFVGVDSRALLRRETGGQSVFNHQAALVEPSKLLEGVLIDGLGVTQPEDVTERSSLLKVVTRLLAVCSLDYAPFTLTADTAVRSALAAVKSPQFAWNTQTTVWECLVRIAAVINCLPRLTADANGKFTVVTFDFINAYGTEVAAIDDVNTNVMGESVTDNNYSTALSSVVENLKEE